ncbi:MAG: phosphoribosylanthranilate isomerase [Arhodomonas sp.]|nr:phosphoribosylanthranilate isomerase [Arhodomonas sp.]
MRTRIKVCGITREVDARAAAHAGSDAIGLVFYPRSRRLVSVEQARRISAVTPPFVDVVALFLDADADEVRTVLDAVPVDVLQFHGRESASFCEAFGRRYLKVLAMGEGAPPPAEQVSAHPRATGFLLDSHGLGQAGGTGAAFDWGRFPRDVDAPLILAGGLAPGNVAEAVRRTRPWAVDVSSGVESAPGIKDSRRIETFIREVERVRDH